MSALAIWGVIVFLDGAKKSRGEFDGYIAFRSAVKIALGAFVLSSFQESIAQHISNLPAAYNFFASTDQPFPLVIELASVALWVIAVWCLVTGLTKFLLALRGWKRKKKPPAAPKDPHGKGRPATRKESPVIMSGEGRRSKMDGVKF